MALFVFLLLILTASQVFSFIFKVFNFALTKITASYLLEKETEEILALDFKRVGIQGRDPDGVLPKTQEVIFNSRSFRVEREVVNVADPLDGLSFPADQCPLDYKRVFLNIKWDRPYRGEISSVFVVTPEKLLQECQREGGIIKVNAINLQGQPVLGALLEILSPLGDSILYSFVLNNGSFSLFLPPGEYKLRVSKEGYTTESTFSTQEIANPENPNILVQDKDFLEKSLVIDRVAKLRLITLISGKLSSFKDDFQDYSLLENTFNTVVEKGYARLQEGKKEGRIHSVAISPNDLYSWHTLEFRALNSQQSFFAVRVWYWDTNSGSWRLVPEEVLPGNSNGFSSSPVDLAALDPSVYHTLRLEGIFLDSSGNSSPLLDRWQVYWSSTENQRVGNIEMLVYGQRLLGYDLEDNPVLRHKFIVRTGFAGERLLTSLGWDSYRVKILSEGVGVVSSDPPLPVSLEPGQEKTVRLYLTAQTTFYLKVLDQETGEGILGARVLLIGEEKTLEGYTDKEGEVVFALSPGVYTLQVEAEGHDSLRQEGLNITSSRVYIISLSPQE